jgi:threonylcarbamoyladenosine tRNA methylthiotransferase MtaB
VVPFDDMADIYVINTCTVTARTDAESRRLIRRAGRRNPDAKVVVTGCYAQIAFDSLREMPGVDLVLGNMEKKGITGLLKEIGTGPKVMVSDISLEKRAEGVSLESFAGHSCRCRTAAIPSAPTASSLMRGGEAGVCRRARSWQASRRLPGKVSGRLC